MINGPKRWTPAAVVETLVFAAALSGLALALGVGLVPDQATAPSIGAAPHGHRSAGRGAMDLDTSRHTQTVAQAVPAWRARYAALKERQIAALDAPGRLPCANGLGPRERYLDFKLRQGDAAAARTELRGCD